MVEKIALITGSTKGLGLEIAKQLAAAGCKIVLTGRSEDALEVARMQLTHPSKHIVFCADLLDPNSIARLYQKPLLPDIIVHNLGGKINGDEQPLKENILLQCMALNLGVAVSINSHYLPLMQKKHYGRVIHISSEASETGCSAPGYVASKAAINAYVKSTARFYAISNIMICSILPGVFLYPGSAWDQKKTLEPEIYHKRLQAMPLGRFLAVEEIAKVISEIANSSNMTYSGSVIKLAGAY